MIAADYAKALYELGGSAARLSKLKDVLKSRGHEALLPKIFAEYQKLELAESRRQKAAEVTPERERTRVLLELYNKLIHG